MKSVNKAQRGDKGLRASVRIGILPERGAPWGCKWTLSPPQVIRTQALKWVQKQYGDGALGRNGTLVIADTPGMLADVILACSRLKMGFNPLPATTIEVESQSPAKFLSVAQPVRKMHVSRQTIYTWIGSGKIETGRTSKGKYGLSEEQLARPAPRPRTKHRGRNIAQTNVRRTHQKVKA